MLFFLFFFYFLLFLFFYFFFLYFFVKELHTKSLAKLAAATLSITLSFCRYVSFGFVLFRVVCCCWSLREQAKHKPTSHHKYKMDNILYVYRT